MRKEESPDTTEQYSG